MFIGCLVLGLVWKRGMLSLLIVTYVIAVGLGIYLGNWSFLKPPVSILHNLIYITVTCAGYFVFFVLPAMFGAILGNVLRNSRYKK